MIFCRLDQELKQLERKKQSLVEQYIQKKRVSDSSSQGSSHAPSKKTSVCSMDALNSPPLHKKVVRLQEYEEGENSVNAIKEVAVGDSIAHHAHDLNRDDKISEMERRVMEKLDASLSTSKQGKEAVISWSKGSMVSIPLHPTATALLDRQSPVLAKWAATTPPSDGKPTAPLTSQSPAFGLFTPPPPSSSPTSTVRPNRSGFHSSNSGHKSASHSDSSEWTEYACVSTSGGSVEVGGGGGGREVGGGGRLGSNSSSSSNQPSSSGETALCVSEFDPIGTAAPSVGDPSKPPTT